jgi:hypothetical protein
MLKQLGHKSAKLTFDTYGHVLPSVGEDLSYLPIPGAGTRETLRRVKDGLSD